MAIAIEPIRLSLIDAARYIGVGPRKFQYLIEQGKIGYVTDTAGGTRYYLVDELRRYVSTLSRVVVSK